MPNVLEFIKTADAQITGKGTNLSATKYTWDNNQPINNLKVKISFGAGRAAEIPWIAFLGYSQKVGKGIYPVLLYYKKYDILILSYGLSENNQPSLTWPDLGDSATISEYFELQGYGKPRHYGNSYVFKVYDKKDIAEEEIQRDILTLINIYHNVFKDLQTQDELQTNNVKEMKNKKEPKTPKEIIEHAFKYISSLGFHYKLEEIANFYLALRTKPFVILAGISGTGKTQLPRKFAESLGFASKQIIQVPVRPDWTDGSELLGYTSLGNQFIPKDLTIAILKASLDKGNPYFFILDEMNLAKVEHYFSDFLSIIETRKWAGDYITTDPILREELVNNAKNKKDFSAMSWPHNLFLIGTVNMDETTHSFSRKVLDRANSIEMNDIDLNWINNSEGKVDKLANVDYSLFKTNFLTAADLTNEDKISIVDELGFLIKVNEILKKADLHFAYRVRDEIAFYLVLNKKFNLIKSEEAMDFQLVQKILPRIHGSSERVQIVLVELLNLFEGKTLRSSNFDFSTLEDKIDFENLKYRRASSKIIFMLKRFDDDRFTSFWL